jgi:hypothetical protein
VGQFVDKGYLRFAGQDGLHVHLFHGNTAVFLPPLGDNFQSFSQLGDIDPAVGFNQSDDDIDPILLESMTFLEHLIGLAYSRAIAQIDLQPAPLGVADHP